MMKVCKVVNDKYQKQKVDPTRKEDRISWTEVNDKYKLLKQKLKLEKSPENYINFLIIACMSGVTDIQPRRNEWCDVKIKYYNTKTDNYFLKNVFYFNKYKTAWKNGNQTVVVCT